MNTNIEAIERGFIIRANGFIIEIHAGENGEVFIQYSGNVPKKLGRVIENHKHLFATPDIATMLVCNECSRL